MGKRFAVNRKPVKKSLKKLLNGYEWVGEGLFADVYAKVDRVIKIINKGSDDKAYLRYLRRIGLESENPYFPKVYKVERCIDGKGKYIAVHMERLLDYCDTDGEVQRKALKALKAEYPEDLQANEWDDSYDRASMYKDRIAKTNNPAARECLEILLEIVANDCHEGNLMWRKVGRKFQLVITDPVAYDI